MTGTITANDGGNTITATWQCDPSTGRVTIDWSTNITDSLVVNRNSLVGNNSNGNRVVAIRRADFDVPAYCNHNLVGNWAWDTRRFPVTLFSDGSAVGNDGGRLINGRWTCLDSRRGDFRVVWETGFTDTRRFSAPDSFSGRNNAGTRISVERRI